MSDRGQPNSFGLGGLALAALGGIAALGAALTGPQASNQTIDARVHNAATHNAVDCDLCADPQSVREMMARAMIQRQTFLALPEEDRALITAKTGYSAFDTAEPYGDHSHIPVDPEQYAWVEGLVEEEVFAAFKPIHRHMLATYVERLEEGLPVVAMCFTPDTDPRLVQAFNDALHMTGRFQQTSRWSATATDGGGLGQGDPTTLTYSFVPDGTFVPNLIGVTGNSDLFAFMNGIYGSPAVWQQIYTDMFNQWGELCGNTYVLEPNDDGVQLNGAGGLLGVRGDLRMAGIFIDGNSGTLAYNNFPQDGDMVIDTGDGFYNNTSNNSLALRNVLSHEHGHGMGQLHVCPIQETKLMEPFFSDNFFGPQHDDIQNAQRHYGDPNEHNDTPGTATPFGDITGFNFSNSNFSIDDNDDVDYYEFTLSDSTDLTVTASPFGFSYIQGPQTQQCNSGSTYDSLRIHDLSIDLLESDGSTVIASQNTTGLGEAEVLSFPLAAGTYYIRVNGSSANTVQIYDLSVDAQTIAFLPVSIVLPNGAPETVMPGQTTDFDVQILEPEDTLVANSAELAVRINGGAFNFSALTPQGGDLYTATIPAALCGDSVEFYITAEGVQTGFIEEPAGGPGNPLSAVVSSGASVLFDDDFESNQGWTVTNTAGLTEGAWERGVPVNLNRGDPPSDSDGSGQCYLTENDPNDSNSDVDDGSTILTSPQFDLSAGGQIQYDYWIDSGPGVLDADELRVEVSTDAANNIWNTVRVYAVDQPFWTTDAISTSEFGGGSATTRIRFTATDGGTPSVIECGIDAVLVSVETCENPPFGCDGDVNLDNVVDVNDISFVLFRLGNSGAPGGVEGDADGNGVVDVNDISYVLFRLGPC